MISFNYDRRESDLSCYKQSELQGLADKAGITSINIISGDKQLTHQVAMMTEGRRLWKYCVMLALFFIASEVVLIRFLK